MLLKTPPLEKLSRQLFNIDCIVAILISLFFILSYTFKSNDYGFFRTGMCIFNILFYFFCLVLNNSSRYRDISIFFGTGYAILVIVIAILFIKDNFFLPVMLIPISLTWLIYFPNKIRFAVTLTVLTIAISVTLSFFRQFPMLSEDFVVFQHKISLIVLGFLLLYKLVFLLFVYEKSIRISRQNEIKYRDIFENVYDGIVMLDAEGNIIDYNKAAKDLLEIEELKETQIYAPDLIHVENKETSAYYFNELLNKGFYSGYQGRVKCNNGTFKQIEISSVAIYDKERNFVGSRDIIRDITEQKKGEQALLEAKELLDEAQSVANLGSWVYYYANDELLWSKQLYHLLRVPEGTKISYDTCVLSFVTDEYKEILRTVKREKDTITKFNFSYPYTFSNNETKFLQIRGRKEFDTQGEPLKIIGIVQDITEKKRQQSIIQKQVEELNKKTQDLERYISSNMQLENFAYIASHDLKSPLRTIISFTQLLNRSFRNDLTEKQKDYMSFIISASKNMEQLIGDLLMYAKADNQEIAIRLIKLKPLIEVILKELSATIQERKAIIETKNIPSFIYGDVSRIRQLFQNLIANALKFHQPNQHPKILLEGEERGNTWFFKIQDNGIGISPEYHEKIFLLFKKLHTSNEYEGTGIGLPLCKKIIEQHNGKIWLESNENEGTTFFFTIPKPNNLN